ncbi:MAG: zinc ribbon domain-containing protein [Deltaproteobacteria bacterium]|nr:zinc ribbon domain-containing protein [Deltaproteobacteria bacterium]
MAFCPYCGKEISSGATSCSACEKEITPTEKIGEERFKGTILMPGADALKRLRDAQSAQPITEPEKQRAQDNRTDPGPIEPGVQRGAGMQKQKRGFQATILGTGPVVASALSDIKREPTHKATLLQSASVGGPPVGQSPVALSSTTSSRPAFPKGGTIIGGTAPVPIAADDRPIAAPPASHRPERAISLQQEGVSATGKTELAVAESAMLAPQAAKSTASGNEFPVLKQPEDFDIMPPQKRGKLGTWSAMGYLGTALLVSAAVVVAYWWLNN